MALLISLQFATQVEVEKFAISRLALVGQVICLPKVLFTFTFTVEDSHTTTILRSTSTGKDTRVMSHRNSFIYNILMPRE